MDIIGVRKLKYKIKSYKIKHKLVAQLLIS